MGKVQNARIFTSVPAGYFPSGPGCGSRIASQIPSAGVKAILNRAAMVASTAAATVAPMSGVVSVIATEVALGGWRVSGLPRVAGSPGEGAGAAAGVPVASALMHAASTSAVTGPTTSSQPDDIRMPGL